MLTTWSLMTVPVMEPSKFAVTMAIRFRFALLILVFVGAFQAGIKYAYRHGYDCAIQFDADGQHLPQYIPRP